MKVFKFGGASVKDAAAVRNMTRIVRQHQQDKLLVVVSAMGKTTNALEEIIRLFKFGHDYQAAVLALKQYHLNIITELFPNTGPVTDAINQLMDELHMHLETPDEEDKQYDQVVSLGEVMSTVIVHRFFKQEGLNCHWVDARNIIRTDSTFREGKVDWDETEHHCQELLQKQNHPLYLTQGFIGSDEYGNTTTLGREGSDYTAAIFASCLGASSVTIWKDVPGVMNADPKRLPDATVFEELPYKEAAEMTYYGASVIHPKTIKPLALKNIPLYVKSFLDPQLPGTKIHECMVTNLPPLIVFKENQCLISCKVTDYTFIHEEQLSTIFHALNELNIRLNVMQNSAISFSFCIDFRENKLLALIERLQRDFEVYYNTRLTLITVKNYDAPHVERYRNYPGILLEQSSRSTLQVLVRAEP
ncbi:MAG: aspartate kinase [Cyclobacteriaceae bacterium]|jgi:aspartate kinase|nr:aspartate kinase [Cyclobacteriaceae bacterium]